MRLHDSNVTYDHDSMSKDGVEEGTRRNIQSYPQMLCAFLWITLAPCYQTRMPIDLL